MHRSGTTAGPAARPLGRLGARAASLLVATAVVVAVTGCNRGEAGGAAATTTTTTGGPLGGTLNMAPQEPRNRPTASAPPTTYVNDPTRPVDVVPGQTVGIRVETSPTADRGWQVETYDQARLFDVGAEPDPGDPGTTTLLFRALAPGAAPVVLRYGVLDQPAPGDRRVTFTVQVAEPGSAPGTSVPG